MISIVTSRTAQKVSSCSIRSCIRSSKPSGINFAIRWHGGPKVEKDAPTVQITFVNPHPATTRLKGGASDDDNRLKVDARVGETLLQTAHRHDIDLEGACEGGKVFICSVFSMIETA